MVNKEFVSLFLRCLSSTPVTAQFSAELLAGPIGFKSQHTHNSGPTLNEWGYATFCEKAPFESFQNEGSLVLRIKIQAIQQNKLSSWSRRRNSIESDMLKVLRNETNADITFCIDHVKIKAHKAMITARAPSFGELCGMALTSATTEIDLHNVDVDVF